MERIVQLFREEQGRQFDPDLVKVFLDNLGRFVEIKETYKDAPPDLEH